MPRRFNYTGRKKINRSDAEIRLVGTGKDLRFDAKLTLEPYKLDPDGRIAVEAYRARTASYRRFEYGRINSPFEPADRSLAEFLDPDGILFRVKVTLDNDGLGRLLAEADGIQPRMPDDADDSATPLLNVICQDLGGEAWRLEYTGVSAPVLAIDRRIPAGHDFARDPYFRALAVPAILREILTRILITDKDDRDDDPEHWTSRWIAFAKSYAGNEEPDEDDDDPDTAREWIEVAVREFSRKGRLAEFLTTAAEEPA